MADTTRRLIDQVRDLPKTENYTSVSIRQDPTARVFNAIEGMITRKIKVSGVRLVWDQYEPGGTAFDADGTTNRLINYSGSSDIELLEMYADEVIIRSPVVLPQAEVWICARRLVFERDGRIDTTPLPYAVKARRPTRDTADRPLDERGQIAARDGAGGMPGGRIILALREPIVVPAGTKETARFCTKGGAGQEGEAGGYLDYVAQNKPQRGAPSDEEVPAILGEPNVWSLIPNPHSEWKLPARWDKTFASNAVFWLKVRLYDDTVSKLISNVMAPTFARTTFLGKPDALLMPADTLGEKVWPGGVPAAYPSGRGGSGGPAGGVICLGQSDRVGTPGITMADLLDATVAMGGKSPTQPGRVPAYATNGPRPPAFVEMKVVRHIGLLPTKVPPTIKVTGCPFPITAGDEAPGRPGLRGTTAAVSAGPDALKALADPKDPTREAFGRQLIAGPHPLQVEPVLQFARDAYLNGHRDEARKSLAMYGTALERIPVADRSAEVLSQLTEIKALMTRMDNNLDYYGNPPGWLPRLSLVSNLQLFFSDQKNAVELLYYAYKLEKSWTAVENQAQLLKSTSRALGRSIELAQSRFGEALRLLDSSRTELATIDGKVAESKRKVEALNARIDKEAQDKAREQAIFSSICDFAAGLTQVIPVGQPFLGAAGSTVFKLAGNIDLSNPNGAAEAFTFAKGFGDSVKTFIETNQDQLSEASDASFARKLKVLGGSLEATEGEISKINDQVATEFDAKTAAYRKKIEDKIAALEKESEIITGAAQETAKLKIRSFKEEVALYKGKKLHEAVIALRKEQAAADKKGLSAEDLAAKTALLTDLGALETKKKQLTAASKSLEAEQKNQAAFMKDALTTASSIGAGIGSVASGLSKLVVPVSPDDPAVKAIRSKIAESKQFKVELAGLTQDVDALAASKQKLMESIGRAQNQASECCATIAKSLIQAAAIGRQLQDMGASLNLDVKAFARDLRKRSEERLRKSLYFVVKSYEYAYLKRVDEDVFGQGLVDQIRQLEETKHGVAGSDTLLSETDFAKIYEVVFRDKFAALGNKIIDDLQHLKASMQNQYLCTMRDDHLKTLNETWRFPFRIVETFQKTGGHGRDVVGARILGIVINTLEIETSVRGLSLDIEFTHSGEHLIGDPAGYQYYFRIGKYPVEAQDGSHEVRWVDDDPISWRMIYNAAAAEDKKVVLDSTSTDKVIGALMLREFKEKDDDGRTDLKLKEHRPSFTSEITLTIDDGLDLTKKDDQEHKLKKPFTVKKLEFYVFFDRQ